MDAETIYNLVDEVEQLINPSDPNYEEIYDKIQEIKEEIQR